MVLSVQALWQALSKSVQRIAGLWQASPWGAATGDEPRGTPGEAGRDAEVAEVRLAYRGSAVLHPPECIVAGEKLDVQHDPATGVASGPHEALERNAAFAKTPTR